MKQSGFTLVELLATLAVIAILVGLAMPGLAGLIEAQQRLVAARELANGIRTARVAAITRNQAVSIQAIDQDWSNGWRIIAGRPAQQTEEQLLLERALSGKTRIVGNTKVAQKLSFTGLGGLQGGGNGTLHICLKNQQLSHYQVVVAITGHVRIIEASSAEPLCG